MKKTNTKLMAILVSIIVVVVAFMAFEIPAFAEEMNNFEENVEMTVENENEQKTISELETETNEEEPVVSFEFGYTYTDDVKIEVITEEQFEIEEIDYTVKASQAKNNIVELNVIDFEEENNDEINTNDLCENKETAEEVKIEKPVVKAVEDEKKTENTVIEETAKTEEKADKEAQESVKTEINNDKNNVYANYTVDQIVNAENNIVDDYNLINDYKLTWVQDIDAFCVNEKRAILA